MSYWTKLFMRLGKLQRAHPTLRGHFTPAYLVGSNMLRAYLFFIYGHQPIVLVYRCADGGQLEVRKADCCCSMGVGWGPSCERCPAQGTKQFNQLCHSQGMDDRGFRIDQFTFILWKWHVLWPQRSSRAEKRLWNSISLNCFWQNLSITSPENKQIFVYD